MMLKLWIICIVVLVAMFHSVSTTSLHKPKGCNPCASIKCKRGFICIADQTTCQGRCEYYCGHCRNRRNPCKGVSCGPNKFCKTKCFRCGYSCISKNHCRRNPCRGGMCRKNERCVPNFRECTHTCTCKRACTKKFRPICGSDGVTYRNKCLFKIAVCESKGKLTKKNNGPCPKPCNIPCENEVQIVCGSDNRNYLSDCHLNNAICKSGGILQKRHDGFCSDVYQQLKGLDLKPVCGSDGKTYSNEAFLNIFNCLRGLTITKVLDRPCECKGDTSCQDVFICIAQYQGATVTACQTKCLPTPCARPPDPEPLFCGTDGVTYTNCALSQKRCLTDGKLGIRSNGPCKPNTCETCENEHFPICGTDGMTYTSECYLDLEICLRGDGSLKKKHNGPCKEFYDLISGAEFKPVCASDGNMYSNDAYVGLERCRKNVVTVPCQKKFPRCTVGSNKRNLICGFAITLFCTKDCKTCCVSPNTCGPDGFVNGSTQCGFESPTEI